MEDQIFAWTGPTPKSGNEYASFVQMFRDKDKGEYRLTIRGPDGQQHSVSSGHDLPLALVRDLWDVFKKK